jgi:ABC-2 type transport system ATP-binding protein
MDHVRLRVSGVGKSFRSIRALDGVSLEMRGGEVVGLLGANGAGKTTLIRIVAGLLDADQGTVKAPARIGYLPEERGLYARHAPVEILRYIATLKGLSRAAAAADVTRWLERVELAVADGTPLERFSKGQQQKVQLVAALLGDPDLLVLDEPYSGLDPLNARLVSSVAREAAADGRAVLLSAHVLPIVEQVCDRIVMLAGGRVVLDGTVDEIRARGASLQDVFIERATQGEAR